MTFSSLSKNSLANIVNTPWAKPSSGGTVTTYTNSNGWTMEVRSFTASGTLVVDTPGYAEVLLVSGGSGSESFGGYEAHGGAGDVLSGLWLLPAGSHAVTVGAGGIRTSGGAKYGGKSSIGSVLTTGFGRMSAGLSTVDAENSGGRDFSITGTAVNYGVPMSMSPRANRGDGRNINAGAGSGSTGVVIVAVRI